MYNLNLEKGASLLLETILAVMVAVVGLITAIVQLVTGMVEAKKSKKNNRHLCEVAVIFCIN